MTNNTYIDSRLIVLNSKDAIKNNSTFNSDVNFPFLGLLRDEEKDIIQVDCELINLQIPVSFYSVNETNNILNFSTDGINILPLTITKGNYNANSLANEISGLFLLVYGLTIVISINRITGVLTFLPDIPMTFYKLNSTAFRFLGFTEDITSIPENLLMVAPNPLNLATINQISIKSNSLETYSYSSSNNGGLSNVVATLSITEPPFGILNYQSQNKQARLLRNKVINFIDILITDENGNLLNLNNVDWTITFSINLLRRFNLASLINFSDILRNGSIRNYQQETLQNQNEELPEENKPNDDTLEFLMK